MAAIGIAEVGTDDRLIFANRWLCDLLGYSPAELQGVHIGQISHPDDRNAVNAELVHLWSGRMNSLQVEKRYLRKDGSTVWVKATISVKRASSGKPEYEIAVFEDITARKHQLLRLEHGVTRCLAEADSESAALQNVMGVLCENQGWPFAEYWGVDEQAGFPGSGLVPSHQPPVSVAARTGLV